MRGNGSEWAAINLSILDFKLVQTDSLRDLYNTINLSILDFKQ